jgi:hypothetical protein
VLAARVVFGILSALAVVVPAAAMDGPYETATTRIQVRLDERLSSQDAKAGDVFHFDTTSSVMVAGRFYPAETHGHGVVVAARSGRGPQPGRLVVAARSLDPTGAAPVEVGLEPGELNRTLEHDVRGFTVPVGTEPIYVGTPRITNVVYEKGTLFYVDAPPPATPVPLPEATGS